MADNRQNSPSGQTFVPGLYIVPTPLGNASDITLRALNVLQKVDILACEDTRTTGKLLNLHGIAANGRLQRYDDHSGAGHRPALIAALQSGRSVALLSDAGTPLIADPGYKLVNEAQTLDITVIPLPGPCAAITALSASGLASDRFYFAGFFPQKTTARKSFLQSLAAIHCTTICYETAPRLLDSLQAIREVLGPNHPVTIARELTKLHEDFFHGTAENAIQYYRGKDKIRGEIVLLIGACDTLELSEESVNDLLRNALETCSVKAAVADVTAKTGLPRKQVYALALALQSGKNHLPEGDG